MKKILVVLVISFSLLMTSSVFVGGEENEHAQVSISYLFGTPELEKISIGDIVYDKLTLEDAPCFGNPGEPCLPIKGAFILLPQDSKVVNIFVETGKQTRLGEGFNIIPAGEPVPISKIHLARDPVPDETIYGSTSMFPGEFYSKSGVYSFRGYDILVLSLYPVQYVPLTGELLYYPSLTVKVETAGGNVGNPLFRGLSKDKTEVLNKVDNPVEINTYSNKIVSLDANEQYDLLILTTDEFKDDFQPLKDAHDNNGLATVIKTLSDINLIPDLVTPEDIRDFVREEYLNHGIEYLLIGGDADVVHDKPLYVWGFDEDIQSRLYQTILPVDNYYGCLDGTYNYDNDELWGERTDGENGEDVDLIAEVFVGRACVDNVFDVDNFVKKTIDYINTNYDDPYFKKVLMAGEYLGDHGIASYGGNHLDLLIDVSNQYDYTTDGIPSDKYEIETLYDRDLSEGWSREDLKALINDDVHILNHDGHSYYGYNMRMSNNDVYDFTNKKFFFGYSSGCMAGGFDDPDGYDCFAEYMTVKTDNGAFAGLWNARYGWFWSQRLDGDGTRFAREFWDAVFGENIPVIGKANQDSKEDNLNLLDRSCMRWTYYQLNLFGDPSLAFHVGNPPDKPSRPEGPSSGEPGGSLTYLTSISEPDGEHIYYLFNWGDGSDTGWIGPKNSDETCEASHSWASEGTYKIKVKAKDINGMESGWSDPLSVNIPKNRNKMLFHYPFILKLLEYYSRNFPMIRNILGL